MDIYFKIVSLKTKSDSIAFICTYCEKILFANGTSIMAANKCKDFLTILSCAKLFTIEIIAK